MTPPLKRRRNDSWNTRCDLQQQNVDPLPLSSLSLQSKGSKITPSAQDPTKRALKKRSSQVQSKSRTSISFKTRTQISSSRKIGEKNAGCSSIGKSAKPIQENKILEKATNEKYLTLLSKKDQSKRTSSGSPPLPLSLQSHSYDSKSEVTSIDEDLISDWDEDDLELKISSSSHVQTVSKKRAWFNIPGGGKNVLGEFSSGSQKFSHKFKQKLAVPVQATNHNDFRPWAEEFAPNNLQELAVHKQKVADVRTWLEGVLSGHIRQRLLLLKGPPGSGKTTTVKLLAESMKCQILEWRNPIGPMNSSDGILSMSAQFEEFLGRGSRYGQLGFFSTDDPKSTTETNSTIDFRQSIILIEEFPNTLTKSSSILQYFQSSILNYLISNIPSISSTSHKNFSFESIVPVVMVVSETLLTSFTASADSFTAHRLLGPKILLHPGNRIIEFNPIAPTFLTKALELVVQKEARKSGRKMTPGVSVLKKLGESGDIRSAIGSLEFLCLRGDNDGDWSAKVSFGSFRSRAKNTTMTRLEKESLQLITQREVSLGIFHAVGKVIYNRREDPPPKTPLNQNPECLPSFLTIHSRLRTSLVSVNELIDETGTDTQTFVSALHENYLLSCDASPSCFEFSTLDHVNGCIDALSDSDLTCFSWYDSVSSSPSGDIFHRDEISFQIAVRGLLFSLPFPVRRKAPAASRFRKGNTGEAYSIFYPTSLRLWRTKEDIESIVSLWVNRILKGELHDISTANPGALDVANAERNTIKISSSSSLRSNGSATKEIPQILSSNLGKKTMLLERLPYMAKIIRSRKNQELIMLTKEIEKVTTFVGIGRVEEIPVGNQDEGSEDQNWATDEPDETNSFKKQVGMFQVGCRSDNLLIQQHGQKMTIPDDDIEDE